MQIKFTTNGVGRPVKAPSQKVTISVFAVVAGKSIENPATKAESDAVWASRKFLIESSPDGVAWSVLGVATDPELPETTLRRYVLENDSSIQDLSGDLFYRIVSEGGGTPDFTNIEARMQY